MYSTINFTVNPAVLKCQSWWPIFSGTLPLLPPLQWTVHYNAEFIIPHTVHYQYTGRVYCKIYSCYIIQIHQSSWLRKGFQKNPANYPHLVDKRLTPPPYPRRPKFIIFILRNFFIHICWTPPPLAPYPFLSRLIILFEISIYQFFPFFFLDYV